MNINTGFINLGIFKGNKFPKKNYFSNNLSPLKADMVSFKGRKFDTRNAVNLSWIDNNKVRRIIALDILGLETENTPITLENMRAKGKVTLEECRKVIEYFGYKRISGQGKGDHGKYRNQYGAFFMLNPSKSDSNCIDANGVATLSHSLCMINRTKGELCPQSSENHGKPTEKEVKAFVENIEKYENICLEKNQTFYKNPYRLKLEQYKQEQAQQQNLQSQERIREIQKEIPKIKAAERTIESSFSRFQKSYDDIVSLKKECLQDIKNNLDWIKNDIENYDENIKKIYAEDINSLTTQINEIEKELKTIEEVFNSQETQETTDNYTYYKSELSTLNNNIKSDEIQKLQNITEYEEWYEKYNTDKLSELDKNINNANTKALEVYEKIYEKLSELENKVADLSVSKDNIDNKILTNTEQTKAHEEIRKKIKAALEEYDNNQKVVSQFKKVFSKFRMLVDECQNNKNINQTQEYKDAKRLRGHKKRKGEGLEGMFAFISQGIQQKEEYLNSSTYIEQIKETKNYLTDEEPETIEYYLNEAIETIDNLYSNLVYPEKVNYVEYLKEIIEEINIASKNLQTVKDNIEKQKTQEAVVEVPEAINNTAEELKQPLKESSEAEDTETAENNQDSKILETKETPEEASTPKNASNAEKQVNETKTEIIKEETDDLNIKQITIDMKKLKDKINRFNNPETLINNTLQTKSIIFNFLAEIQNDIQILSNATESLNQKVENITKTENSESVLNAQEKLKKIKKSLNSLNNYYDFIELNCKKIEAAMNRYLHSKEAINEFKIGSTVIANAGEELIEKMQSVQKAINSIIDDINTINSNDNPIQDNIHTPSVQPEQQVEITQETEETQTQKTEKVTPINSNTQIPELTDEAEKELFDTLNDISLGVVSAKIKSLANNEVIKSDVQEIVKELLTYDDIKELNKITHEEALKKATAKLFLNKINSCEDFIKLKNAAIVSIFEEIDRQISSGELDISKNITLKEISEMINSGVIKIDINNIVNGYKDNKKEISPDNIKLIKNFLLRHNPELKNYENIDSTIQKYGDYLTLIGKTDTSEFLRTKLLELLYKDMGLNSQESVETTTSNIELYHKMKLEQDKKMEILKGLNINL